LLILDGGFVRLLIFGKRRQNKIKMLAVDVGRVRRASQ